MISFYDFSMSTEYLAFVICIRFIGNWLWKWQPALHCHFYQSFHYLSSKTLEVLDCQFFNIPLESSIRSKSNLLEGSTELHIQGLPPKLGLMIMIQSILKYEK